MEFEILMAVWYGAILEYAFFLWTVIYFVSDIGTYHPMNVLTCCRILPILAWSTGDLIQWYVFPKLILDMYVISCFLHSGIYCEYLVTTGYTLSNMCRWGYFVIISCRELKTQGGFFLSGFHFNVGKSAQVVNKYAYSLESSTKSSNRNWLHFK